MDDILIPVIIALVVVVLAFGENIRKLLSGQQGPTIPTFARFPDKYTSVDEVADALRDEGLESCNLIIGIDFTRSNQTQGKHTFNGQSLHHIEKGQPNPYQQAISILSRTLEKFDEDGLIPVFGFGDMSTKDHSVFPFYSDRDCEGCQEVLDRYEEVVPTRTMSGPTNFAPLIYKALDIVKASGRAQYHVLVIIGDGQVTNERETIEAIVAASAWPLSIIQVGVGDGPWDTMNNFDDNIPKRAFDNFQFVNFHEQICKPNPDAKFALNALMEVPQQFAAIKKLGLLGKQ